MHDEQRSRFLLHLAAAAALLAAGAAAQGAPPAGAGAPDAAAEQRTAADQTERQRQHDALMPKCYLRGVEVRVPSEMRNTAPQLLGLEEAGIAFRDQTPALAVGDIAPKIIDPEQLRQQRLAAYERPWAPFGAPPSAARPGARPVPPNAAAKSAPPSGGGWAWSMVLALAIAGGCAWGRRRRAAA